jgi:probable HAF family extracellular repeat protein
MYIKYGKVIRGLALAATLSLGSSAMAQQYKITPLDSPAGATDVYATGINNAGQMVGYTVDANGKSHAALWAPGGAHTPLQELTNASGQSSQAYRINNAGQIVGKSRFDATFDHAVIWNAGVIQDIGVLPGANGGSFAQDINDQGVVAGSSKAATGQHAFTWTQANGFKDWGSFNPGSNSNIAGWNAINNGGVVAGTAYVLFSPFKASMARPGDTTITNISPVAQFSTGMALAINDSDTIVGYQNPNSGNPHPAIFNGDGTWQDLGTMGLGEGWAEDINEDGVIVGRVMGFVDDVFIQKAYVYQNGVMTDLLDALGPQGLGDGWSQLFSASGINDNGEIVGAGIYNGQITGFMISPVPEPATMSVIGLAGATLLSRRRRV